MVLRVRPTPTRFPTNPPGGQHTHAFYTKCVMPEGHLAAVACTIIACILILSACDAVTGGHYDFLSREQCLSDLGFQKQELD